MRYAYLKDLKRMVLISCGLDRSLIFRDLHGEQRGKRMFSLYHQEIEKNSKILSFELSQNHHTLFVGLDKKINLY